MSGSKPINLKRSALVPSNQQPGVLDTFPARPYGSGISEHLPVDVSFGSHRRSNRWRIRIERLTLSTTRLYRSG